MYFLPSVLPDFLTHTYTRNDQHHLTHVGGMKNPTEVELCLLDDEEDVAAMADNCSSLLDGIKLDARFRKRVNCCW